MKIKELIEKLLEVERDYGNLPVYEYTTLSSYLGMDGVMEIYDDYLVIK